MGEAKSNIIKRCPRCQSLLLHEANEVYCLMCGWRPLAATVEKKISELGTGKTQHMLGV